MTLLEYHSTRTSKNGLHVWGKVSESSVHTNGSMLLTAPIKNHWNECGYLAVSASDGHKYLLLERGSSLSQKRHNDFVLAFRGSRKEAA